LPARKETSRLPLKIPISKGQNLERALKQLKRKMATEGISKEIRKHNYYEKPCERRRRKQKERMRALRKAQRDQLNQ
jgi:small subunit ribosomal protein S21